MGQSIQKNGRSKICGRQPLTNLKWYGQLFHSWILCSIESKLLHWCSYYVSIRKSSLVNRLLLIDFDLGQSTFFWLVNMLYQMNGS